MPRTGTGRAEGLKRWASGAAVNADPWRLFPALAARRASGPSRRNVAQDAEARLPGRPPGASPELWVAVHGKDPKAVWAELRGAELKPWIHRRVLNAAKLPADTNLTAFESYQAGHITPHDIASQAVAIVCDPDPGERWWDVNSDNGLHALHLADRMKGRGVVVASFEQRTASESDRAQAAQIPFSKHHDARLGTAGMSSANRILMTVCWSTPSRRAWGTWRRNPDARWTIVGSQIPRAGRAAVGMAGARRDRGQAGAERWSTPWPR